MITVLATIELAEGRRPLRADLDRALQEADAPGAARTFAEAIDVDARTTPAYLSLGDVRERQGNLSGAVEIWEQLIEAVPDHAHFAFDRLERRISGRRGPDLAGGEALP